VNQIQELGADKVIQNLWQSMERSFNILPSIHRAHQLEKMGDWGGALGEYEGAYAIDRDNVYIWRHIAKTRTKLYDFGGAAQWWYRVLDAHKHPSHYRRLAYNLACLGDLLEAGQVCEKAIGLDPKDAKCYEEWGNILYQLERFDEAIEKLRRAEQLDPAHRSIYLLRIAEVRFAQGQYRDAMTACAQAFTCDPDNPDIPFWIMKIRRAELGALKTTSTLPTSRETPRIAPSQTRPVAPPSKKPSRSLLKSRAKKSH